MKNINHLPTPIAGLALGSIALGNMLQTYSQFLKNIFSIISLLIIILLTFKFLFYKQELYQELKNPLITTTLATFPMSIMLLSVFLKGYIGTSSVVIWTIGFLLDITLVYFVIYNFILSKHSIKNIYPTWFITFVGPAVITVTAISYNIELLGKIFFYFSFINYLILISLVLYRVYVYKHLKQNELPTITVFAAPGGLLLASYMIGITNKNEFIIKALLTLAIIFYLFVLLQLPLLLNRKFYPSFSAFTFPLVICAIAFQKVCNYYGLTEFSILKILSHLSEGLAIFIVIFVIYHYVKNFKEEYYEKR